MSNQTAEQNNEGADIRKDSVRQARDTPCDALSLTRCNGLQRIEVWSGEGPNATSKVQDCPGCADCGPKSVDRKAVLLRAAFDLLQKQKGSHYVLNLLEQTAHYDGTDCDGHCLMQDIADELDILVNS